MPSGTPGDFPDHTRMRRTSTGVVAPGPEIAGVPSYVLTLLSVQIPAILTPRIRPRKCGIGLIHTPRRAGDDGCVSGEQRLIHHAFDTYPLTIPGFTQLSTIFREGS